MSLTSTPSAALPSWPLCTAVAKQLAKELQLDYYNKPDRMRLMEVLHLLLPKAKLGVGIPKSVQGTPWRLPDDDNDSLHGKINALLNHSLMVQMGTVPGTEFDTHILSSEALAVCGLIQMYLETAFDMKVNIVTGIMRFVPGKADGTPTAWLEIDGNTVENSYVHVKGMKPSPLIFKLRTVDAYSKDDLGDIESKREQLFAPRPGMDLELWTKLLRLYGKRMQSEKYLLCCFRMAQVVPGIKMYDILMRDFVQRVHGKAVPDLEFKWESVCWACFRQKPAQELKLCAVCKLAKYCGAECQKKEWKSHKVLHSFMEELIASAVA